MSKQYDIPLRLTTPHMAGPKVNDAQWLMAGHSRFKGLATYKDGTIDGDYGLLTAQATKKAKYWVGYPTASCDMVFGQTLYEYLRPNDWRPLPTEYRDRRAARIAAAAATPGKKALAYAVNEVGNKEYPFGSNLQKYGAWYGFNGVPWCAIFESYCFGHTGWPSYRYAAVEQIVSDARYGRNHLSIVRSPMPGDVIAYKIHGDPYAHTAFFEKWLDPGASFQDLGGNTGPTNISNGGIVMRQERPVSMVTAFVRVTA
jgi:hypothetical protein